MSYQSAGVQIKENPEITSWYSGSKSSGPSTVLKAAFASAWTTFSTELAGDDFMQLSIGSKHSIEDVLHVVKSARDKYAETRQSKFRLMLEKVSERLVCYQNVFDVMVQHHPEYVGLAWGAFKLLFTAFVNHEECLKKLAKATTRIAEHLPRCKLSALLYPTLQMESAIAHLYTHIMRFLESALAWYKKSKSAHVLTSIWHPWPLKYQEEYDNILDASQRVDVLATSGHQAETRGIHLELVALRTDVSQLSQANRMLSSFIESRMSEIDRGMISLNDRLDGSFGEQKATLCQMQVNQLLSLSFWTPTSTSGQSLNFCQSVDQRLRGRVCIDPPDINRLNSWAQNPDATVLFTNSRTVTSAKVFAVRLVELLKGMDMPVIWALRYPDYFQHRLTTRDILRVLVFQALAINPKSQSAAPNPLTAAHLREAASDGEWIEILKRCLLGLRMVFLVLDPELVSYASSHDRYEGVKLVENLVSKLNGTARIVISRFNVESAYVQRKLSQQGCLQVNTEPTGHFHRSQQTQYLGRRIEQHRRNQRRKTIKRLR